MMTDETRTGEAGAAGDDGHGAATVTCPRCGAEKPAGGTAPPGWIATPAGSTVLTTVGMARKAAAGEGEHCACGRRRLGDASG